MKNKKQLINEPYLLGHVVSRYENYENARNSQLSDNRLIKYAILGSVQVRKYQAIAHCNPKR